MNEQWDGIPACWGVYIAVEDTDKAAVAAAEAGGTVNVPPFDTPYGRISVIADPDGGVFSAIKLSDPE